MYINVYETAISTAFATFTPGRGVLGLSSKISLKLPNVFLELNEDFFEQPLPLYSIKQIIEFNNFSFSKI